MPVGHHSSEKRSWTAGRRRGDAGGALVVTATQAGFAAGLVLVLPLGDLVRRRSLLTALLLLDAAALATAGLATGPGLALVAFALVGLGNVAAQVLVPAAADLAGDEQRGRVVATVISGLLTGMLLARTVSGLVTAAFGWRPVFLGAGCLMLLVLAVLRRALAGRPGPAPAAGGYREALRSTVRLYRSSPVLRVRSAYGALGFAAFSVFWSTAAVRLGGAPFHLAPAAIGVFGLLGAAGAFAANLTGRVRRHRAPAPTIAAVAIIALAWAALWAGSGSLAAFVAGTLLLDVGVQALHVLNQRTIYEVEPGARNRVNSVYMTFYFFGGAAGSAAASTVQTHAGWTGVCVCGLTVTALAALLWAATTAAGSGRSGK
jgi:predicted MFS family arabinose efflux permease